METKGIVSDLNVIDRGICIQNEIHKSCLYWSILNSSDTNLHGFNGYIMSLVV